MSVARQLSESPVKDGLNDADPNWGNIVNSMSAKDGVKTRMTDCVSSPEFVDYLPIFLVPAVRIGEGGRDFGLRSG